MKIMILGDVGASKANAQAFCDAEKELFSSEIQSLCADADLVMLNLEKIPKPDDAADALAMAICHCHAAGSLIGQLGRR